MTVDDVWQRAIADARMVYEETAIHVWRETKQFNPKLVLVDRKSSVAGRAIQDQRVEINMRLLKTEQDIEETIYHELAHCICWSVWANRQGHGHNWRKIMHRLGQSPTRGHQIDLSESMPDRWVLVVCPTCGQKINMTKKKAERGLRRYLCKACKSSLG